MQAASCTTWKTVCDNFAPSLGSGIFGFARAALVRKSWRSRESAWATYWQARTLRGQRTSWTGRCLLGLLRLSGWLLGRVCSTRCRSLRWIRKSFSGWGQPDGEEGTVQWDCGKPHPNQSCRVSGIVRDCVECESESASMVARADVSAVADLVGK